MFKGDYIVEKLELEKIFAIKIDVEGFETTVRSINFPFKSTVSIFSFKSLNLFPFF